VVGLDSDVADRVERAATDGDTRLLSRILGSVSGQSEAEAVLTLLLEQSRSAIGIEMQNVAAAVLTVAAHPLVDVGLRADAIADALAPPLEADPTVLTGSALPGAWRIGLAATRRPGRRLLALVMRHPETESSRDLGLQIVRDAARALEASPPALVPIFVAHLVSSYAPDVAGAVANLDPTTSSRLLRTSRAELAASIRGLVATAREGGSAGEDEDEAEGTSPSVDPDFVLAALGDLLSELRPGPGGPAQALTEVLLDVNDARARLEVERRIADVGQIESGRLAGQVLRSCRVRSVRRWPDWLEPLTPASLVEDAVDDQLRAMLVRLWSQADSERDRPTERDLVAAGAALLRVIEHRPLESRPDITEHVTESLGPPATDDISAARHVEVHASARPLIASGVLATTVLVGIESANLVETLGLAIPMQDLDGDLVRYVETTTVAVLSGWPSQGVPPSSPSSTQASAVLKALYECKWLPEPLATGLPMIARSIVATGPDTALPALPKATEVAALRTTFGRTADAGVAAWVELAEPSSTELKAVIGALAGGTRASDPLLSVLEKRIEALDGKAKLSIVARVVEGPNSPVPDSRTLQAFGFGRIPAIEVARLIAARFGACGNNTQRRQVLELWLNSSITADGARRHLVENVLIPLLRLNASGGNSQAADLGVEYLPRLVNPLPSGVKKALGDAVVKATRGRPIERRANTALEAVGYRVKKTGFLGRRAEVDTGAPDA
jgi:hypothetical protein